MSIQSQRISELPRLSALRDDDYLILQRNKKSYKISFASFKYEFIRQFSEKSGVKSAISAYASQFARFDHGHDYSDIWFYPTYGPQSENQNPQLRRDDQLCCKYIGQFNIIKYLPGINQLSTTQISAYSPPAIKEINNEVERYQKYKVGDLQYLAVKNFEEYLTNYRRYDLIEYNGISNININSTNFDGFVIPNGTRFQCNTNEFRDACQMYASNPNATSFQVPNLSNTFFRCDPGLSSVNPLQHMPYHNAVPSHNHGGHTQLDSSVDTSITINTGQPQIRVSATGTYVNPFVHWGSGNIDHPCQLSVEKIEVNGSLDSINIDQAGEDGESYPNYQRMQVLLYIGNKR